MPQRGVVKPLGPLEQPCPNCGFEGVAAALVATTTDTAVVGWRGCSACWPLVLKKGQLETIKTLIRQQEKRLVNR